MKLFRIESKAAVALTAAFCIGLALTGCVTKRDIEEVKDSLHSIRNQNVETQRLVLRMDSIITEGAQSNARLTTEIRTSVSDLQQSIARLLENYNDLMQKLDAISRTKEKIIINPSPGAQGGETAKSSTDCIAMYDDAFILVHGSKYDQAITAFRSFLESCPKNENAANAHFWIGDCYYSQEKYTDAVKEFEYVLDHYTDAGVVVKTMYKLGRSKQELGKKDEARKIYKKIVADHKGTLEARQSEERLKELK
jgi:tol-pal system protein YbgF